MTDEIDYTLFDKYTNCDHDWLEVYYGVRCLRCDLFYSDGCEPWSDYQDDYHISEYMEEAYPDDDE